MEITALDSALVFLQEAAADPTPREVRICLNSHSALGRLREGPAAQRDGCLERFGCMEAVFVPIGMHFVFSKFNSNPDTAENV